MQEKIENMYIEALINDWSPQVFAKKILNLLDVTIKYNWLQKDDLEFAVALQEESRIKAVKWLYEKAKGHSQTPLKDAKEILDAYH